MQTVSAEFTTHCNQTIRFPATKFEVRWDGSNWTDESAHVVSHSGSVSLDAPGSSLTPTGSTDEATVVLRNYQWRYSALATGGDSSIRSYLTGAAGLAGIAARISQGFTLSGGDTFVKVFTGWIYAWAEDSQQKQMTLHLRDEGYRFLQHRASTPMVQDVRTDEWIGHLAQSYLGIDTPGSEIGQVSAQGTLIGEARIPGGLIASSSSSGAMVLDKSFFRIPFAWLDDEPILEEMYAAAAAEGGRIYFDHSGVLRFERLGHWLQSPHTSSVWTFDSGDYTNLQPTHSPDMLATSVVVEYAPRYPDLAGTLYTLDQVKTARPGETVTFDVRLQQPAVAIYDPIPETDYWVISAGGSVMNSSITLSMINYGQRARIIFTNNHASLSAQLVYFQLRGVPLFGSPTQEVQRTVSSPAVGNARERSVRGNVYLQTYGQAAYLSAYLADRYQRIAPTWPLRGVSGVPQLELGDRVTISDGRVVSAAREGFVTRIGWRSDASGYRQDIDVLDATGLWPSGTYYAIGSTALGSGVAWY